MPSDRCALGSVRPFDYLLQSGAGHYVLQAAANDRCVLDAVEVALVGARAAVEALEYAPEAVYARLQVLVVVEGDPHHSINAQGIQVAAFQGGKDVIVLSEYVVYDGTDVWHLLLFEHKDVGSRDDLECLVLIIVAPAGVGLYHLEKLRELRVVPLPHSPPSADRSPEFYSCHNLRRHRIGHENLFTKSLSRPLKRRGQADRFITREWQRRRSNGNSESGHGGGTRRHCGVIRHLPLRRRRHTGRSSTDGHDHHRRFGDTQVLYGDRLGPSSRNAEEATLAARATESRRFRWHYARTSRPQGQLRWQDAGRPRLVFAPTDTQPAFDPHKGAPGRRGGVRDLHGRCVG